jgi:hypothetical protein
MMEALAASGWHVVGVIVALVLGMALQKLLARGDQCRSCGMLELKTETTNLYAETAKLRFELINQMSDHKLEIKRLCILVRALAERAGMTVKEQAELEHFEPMT